MTCFMVGQFKKKILYSSIYYPTQCGTMKITMGSIVEMKGVEKNGLYGLNSFVGSLIETNMWHSI